MEAARQFLFETYCRIHQAIDVRSLAGRLGMDEEGTEKWIVNLIRNARLNAKIDSKEGTVVMQTATQSEYEQVRRAERTCGVGASCVSAEKCFLVVFLALPLAPEILLPSCSRPLCCLLSSSWIRRGNCRSARLGWPTLLSAHLRRERLVPPAPLLVPCLVYLSRTCNDYMIQNLAARGRETLQQTRQRGHGVKF
jgi:hypothetical protein